MEKDRGITITNVDKQEQCDIHVVISRLQKLKRFDLVNYRDGEYGIDTEREENDNGDYIDAY